MTDSNVNPRSGAGATSYGVTYSLVTEAGGRRLKMTLDRPGSTASRVPIRSPLTVGQRRKRHGSNLRASTRERRFSGATELHVGTYDGGQRLREVLIAFGKFASQLKNDTVLGAWLGIFHTWSYSCSPLRCTCTR